MFRVGLENTLPQQQYLSVLRTIIQADNLLSVQFIRRFFRIFHLLIEFINWVIPVTSIKLMWKIKILCFLQTNLISPRTIFIRNYLLFGPGARCMDWSIVVKCLKSSSILYRKKLLRSFGLVVPMVNLSWFFRLMVVCIKNKDLISGHEICL